LNFVYLLCLCPYHEIHFREYLDIRLETLSPTLFSYPKKVKPNQIKSNQIKSLVLGIALGSFMQSGVSIHYVLRFFSPDPHKFVISVKLARIEIINSR